MRSLDTFSRICTRKFLTWGLIVCLISVTELNAESCKLGCPRSDSGILQYIPGNVYDYSIDSLLTVAISGNEVDETALKITGHAKLFAEGNCGYTLQLDKISISAVKENLEKQITQNLNKPIKFTLVGGELQPQICADPSDTVNSLNIKRAIVSLLQASDKNYETDVFGVCPTHTSSSKSGPSEIITKVRNLNACSYREQISNGLVTGVVNSKAGIKSSALLSADYSKDLKLAQGIVENVQLVEEYKFSALANGGGSVKAKARTILKLGKVTKGNAPEGANEPTSIIFEQSTATSTKNIVVLKKVFTNTVNLVNNHVQGDAAQYFTELIRLMRSSDTDTLIELSVVPHVNKVLARKVYLDALFRVGTSNSVKAIVRQISKMTEQEKILAFLSLNLVQSVERDALNQAAALLNPSSPKEAYLAIGNLVNKYCKQGTCDQSEVNIVSKKFADGLKHCKANTKKDEDRFVNILKGIRNTHKIADASVQVLIECASADRSARLRVAALQAFTASACDSGLQAKALNILKDHNEDSEIRIEAYLAAIACPNAQLANEIADIVNNEPVNQVGGFIVSSLKAIRDSTDMTREASRHYLSNIRVTKKFPIDPRRFSFNSESSYAVESLGIGASADYNVIYSQNGFLPRSLRLNVTSQIFGTDFNIFEINARQENLEEILEYYFGPNGYIEREGKNVIGDLTSKTRSKRSIADDTNKFAKKYKSYGSKSNADINLDLAIRVFGSELFFLSLGDEVPQNIDEILRKIRETGGNMKNKLKNFEHEYACHSLFLDTEFVYPTGVGLPLELIAQGTTTSKLDLATEVDVDAIVDNPLNAKYRIKAVPSIDVNINGQIRFNALVLMAGLRASNSLHSSSGSDLRFELIKNAEGFNLDVNFPNSNLELIEFKHNVEFIIAEQDKETKIVPLKLKKKKNTPQENCFDQLHYIGMTMCFTSVIPETNGVDSISFPFSGPVHIALRLQTEKNIKLHGTYEKAPEARIWKLKYSTPGSQVPHDTELSFHLNFKTKVFARASLQHPEVRLSCEAGILNDDREIAVYGEYDVNGEVASHKFGLLRNGNELRPLIEIKSNKGVSNEINGYRADGRILKSENGDNVRYTFDNFQIIGKDNDNVLLNGWVDVKPFKSELKIQRGKDVYDIESHFSLDDRYAAGLFVRNQNSPQRNGASIDLQLSQNSVKNALVIAVTDNLFEMNNNLDFVRDEKNAIQESKFTNVISFKEKNAVILYGKLNGEAGLKQIKFNAEVAKDSKKASIDFSLAKDVRSLGDYTLGVSAKLNKHFVDVKAKVDIKGGRYLTENSLSTSWGTQLTAKGEIGQRFTHQDVYIDMQGTFLLTPKDKQGNWLLKSIGSPDKTNSEFKLNRDNADLIILNAETTHPQDKIATCKLNLQIKDLLGAKGEFKINKGGKGDLTALFNFKKAQRKINLDSKFTILAPKYDIETTILYDNDKKLYLKTENIVDKNKVSTKNLLDINGDKVLLDANSAVKGEWRLNGEIEGKLSLKIPNGRLFEGKLNRKMTTAKNGLAQGVANLVISDTLPSNERRTIEINGNLEKLNVKTNEFSATTNFVYTSFEGKKFDMTQKIKHLPKGSFKSIIYNTEVRGDILNTPIDIVLNVDEYSDNHAIFHFSSRYGEHVNSNIEGDYSLGKRGESIIYNLKANVAAPKSDIKTYSLISNGKYLSSESQDGVQSIEFHVDEQIGENTIKLNAFAKGNNNHGSYTFDLKSSHLQNALKLDGGFTEEKTDENSGKMKYNFNYVYGEQFVKTGLDLRYVESKSGVLHYTLSSSFDSIENLDLTISTTNIDDVIQLNSELQLNGQKLVQESSIYTNEHKQGAVLKLILPQKTTTISGIVENLGERKGKLTVSIENLGDLDFEHVGEASLKSFDEFYLTSHTNSQKLKIHNLDFDVRSKVSAEGKGVELKLTNAKGVIISGFVTYIVKKEKSKTIIEGQGQVQYHQKTNNANFKMIHQSYDVASDQEIGYSFTFNGNFGPKNAVSTLKLTNKNFQVKISVCEEKKQCTNIEVRSIVTIDPHDVTSIQHDLMVLVDLRELGYPHEFELQSKSSRKGLKFHHEIESNIISNSNTKYQLIASISHLTNKVQIKLPNREIYIETEDVLPKTLFGHYQRSITFYFDRLNKPNDVTKLIASADINGIEKVAVNAKGEIRFEHPKIRALSISGRFDSNREQRVMDSEIVFDLFKTPEQKIIATSSIRDTSTEKGHGFNITTENIVKSAGLGFQYEASGHSALSLEKQEFSAGYNVHSGSTDLQLSGLIFGSKDRMEVIISSLNEQLVKLVAEYNRNKLSTKITSNIHLFSSKPLNGVIEIDQNTAKLLIKRDGLFDAVAEIKLGKEAKFHVKDGNKKVFSGRIALDAAHFLTTSFENNEADTKSFLKSIEQNFDEDVKLAKEQLEKRFKKIREVIERQADLAKNSAPDLTALEISVKENVKEILQELENDAAIKELLENYKKYYEMISKFYKELSEVTAKTYEKIAASIKEISVQLQNLVKKTLLPALEEFTKKITALYGELQAEILKLLTNLFEQVLKNLKSFETDLKALGKPVYEVLKPISDSMQDLLKILVQDLEELLKDVKEFWSKLPTFEAVRDEIKEKLKNLKSVDEILLFVRNIIDQLNNLSATNESTELGKKLYDYLEAKLKDKPIDDVKALEDIYNALVNALNSLWKRLNELKPAKSSYLTPLPGSIDMFSSLPVWHTVRVSLLNFILNEKLDGISDIIELLNPPFDILPPYKLVGHIADGKNIFSFDGRRLTFKGSCKYILAQDSRGNKFSVVGTIKDGKLKSLTLIDAKNFVEVSDNGALKLNGKPAEYPTHFEDIHAWRRFHTLRLRTEYGVEVTCTSDLKVCHVAVNGFYTSKVRGLFGNGNAEPFDDYTSVDGKIATNIVEFVNDYGLGNCPAIAARETGPVDHDSLCSELFSLDSSLAFGYLFIDHKLYREACDVSVLDNADNKEETACNIALTYASGAILENIPLMLPNRCLKCVGAPGQREIGDEFTVKVPTNKADVIFVVDLGSSKNIINDLVTPAIGDLRNQLKTRGISDTQIIVIAFSDDQLYPAILTSNGGKLNFNGKLSNVEINGPRRPEALDVGIPAVNGVLKWLNEFQYLLGPQADEMAFRLALQYSFRSGAAKSIVAVRSDRLDYSNILKFIRAHLISAITQFEGASLHMIAPVQDLALEGVPVEKLVGFNSRVVATVEGKDAKKRQKLKFKNDMGIDFILQNNGWVFAAQNFDALQSDDQKRSYLNQVTSSIADTLFKTDIVSECQCEISFGLHAEHKCTIKSANFVLNKRPKGA